MTSLSTNQSFVQGLKVAQHLPPSTGTQTSETQSTTLPAEIENLLETLETSSGSGDPSTDGAGVKSALSALVNGLPDTAEFQPLKNSISDLLSTDSDTSTTEIEQKIQTMYQAALATNSPKTTEVATTTSSAPTLTFSAISDMMGLISNLESAVAKVEEVAAQVESTIATAQASEIQTETTNYLNNLAKQEAEERKAKKESFWTKLAGDIVGAVSIALAIAFLGPVGGIVAAAMFTMEQFGAFSKMFGGIHNTALRVGIEFAFCAAVSLAAGGLSGALDMAVSSATEGAAEDTADEAAGSSSSKISQALSQGKGTAMATATQTLFTVNPINDAIVNSKWGKDNPETAAYLSMGITIGAALFSGFAAYKVGSSALAADKMVSSLNDAAEASTGLKSALFSGTKFTMTALRNPAVAAVLIGVPTVGGDVASCFVAETNKNKGNLIKDAGPIQASMTLLQTLSSINTQATKTTTSTGEDQLNSLGALTQNYSNFVLPNEAAVQALRS